MEQRSLQALLDAYRQGDMGAQTELLRLLEFESRGIARSLMGKEIRTDQESVDVVQSLMLAFHLQASDGKIQLENEKALRGLVRTMIRNKLANVSDKIRAAKRGGGKRPLALGEKGVDLPTDLTASMTARGSELRTRVVSELDDEERAIFEGRLLGKTNAEIAADLGKSPDGVRMTWNRARQRLTEIGILKAT
ncbi:MAG: RNA polymerase sigma factor [Planctomycetota bacterium]|jgi:DNA-directed RNA polymerase specialized sigma24 family protein